MKSNDNASKLSCTSEIVKRFRSKRLTHCKSALQ